MTLREINHYVLYQHSTPNRCICFVVYVDDIVHIQTKDLGILRYFLGIKVSRSMLLTFLRK